VAAALGGINPSRGVDEMRSVPDFIILGAMKSGTTTLFEYLSMHPGIFMASPKEPQFFSRRFDEPSGLDWTGTALYFPVALQAS
jgi:hypothetical protein